ncbi:hypothetical protein [Streptomyces longwoodensis]|uniref:hypothetical protein n=1 Tax=Streptomyces longwoodensis TaxID=68231 RepID=UPI0036F4F0B7
MIGVLRRRIGRRGVPLLLLGTGKIAWGIGFVAAPTGDRRGLVALMAVMPMWAWSAVWVAGGLVALWAAFQPVGRDRAGYVVAVGPPLVWGLGYMYAAFTEHYLRAFFIGVWYLLPHVLLILWASSVAEFSLPRSKCQSRRSPPLYLFGMGQVAWAIGYLAAPAPSTHGLEPLLSVLSIRGWAAVWFVSGMLTVTCILLREGPDRWGFIFAAALPLVWGMSFASVWVAQGYGRGFFVGAWYLTSQVGMALWAAALPQYELPSYGYERQD